MYRFMSKFFPVAGIVLFVLSLLLLWFYFIPMWFSGLFGTLLICVLALVLLAAAMWYLGNLMQSVVNEERTVERVLEKRNKR